ncbi:MAG: helicase [Syntrophus sp. RIFOXYC2_FULL_54_9]|nr:MAG: helicase [Syntrophus sp. RIFOXYC2_FULL_54_9]HBB18346.1 helicase [Syntrophus sp. (in: bacteria)]
MTAFCPANPLIVQGDHTILVEVDNPLYPVVRDQLVRFAELVKSPEHIHTYRITPLSIWNACAAGVKAAEITDTLGAYAKYAVPAHVNVEIRDFASRYGRLRLTRREGSEDLLLSTDDLPLAEEISGNRHVAPFLAQRLSPTDFSVNPLNRGRIKQTLIKIGFPAEDLAGYVVGEFMALALRGETLLHQPFALRPYQRSAAEIFHAGGSERGGSGVIVLPCGAGKTIVGMACMSQVQSSTLILTTSVTAIRQWTAELLDKTTLTKDDIGEYSGSVKNIRPITLATYQIMTYRTRKEEDFPHLTLFNSRSWGLIIYDEVHLLPAPVFQITASIQARRRLGLTATLVREDGREDDVFALIGPKKLDIPWKEMESQGWIAEAKCHEIRLPLKEDLRMPYALADARQKFRIASENPDKQALVRKILKRHEGESVLLIGLYIDQIKDIASELQIPLLTGTTTQRKRDAVYADFKEGRVKVLAVSKIANFAVDLPDASVAIQISGTFGSRQEEAQRLGRILRPKNGRNQAHFYNLVTRDTVEQDFALKRQLFLCEQGYEYVILDAAEL